MIIVCGATAAGKTEYAATLAKEHGSPLISADSMQVYRGFNIGTAKETDADLGVKQYGIDILDGNDRFTVVDYKLYATNVISELESKGIEPMVCGGTGFYISSLLYEQNFGAEPGGLEEEIQTAVDADSSILVKYFEKLKQLDPEYAAKLHVNDTRKIIKAYCFCENFGKKYSEQNEEKVLLRDAKIIILRRDRAELYERINKRVDIMREKGLKDEVENLLRSGVRGDSQAMRGIGYKEWLPFIDGQCGEEEVYELIKKNSRNYAKRQETWFNHQYPQAEFKTVS
ncbi:MAG: tRNA (adenosine(37)-N6)-dimethylallyltransferase MiaA [Christensenellaceae bacterium]|jgi:tRNA dimethylallyltransferase|nr:tRNA (adenosine(37)-N6)-dimethylallyltransferase MiaA [Christensenellaceae bacterium]